MCILFLAINQHRDYPLIICANRDEFYARPTRAATFWPENPQLLAGKDLQAGGSWLGVNLSGRFAAVTNIRSARANVPQRRSRGELVTRALEHELPLEHSWLVKHKNDFNPFNLIYGSPKTLYCFNSDSGNSEQLLDGFHAVSNGLMDEVWPKMSKGKKQLEQCISSLNAFTVEDLLALLKDESKANPEQLPRTGVSLDLELLLSSIFIRSENYGTRSSAVILYDKSNNVEFCEVEYGPTGQINGLNQHSFALQGS